MDVKKKHIRELIKEAIPSSDEGIINFRALRDVLEASVEHHTANVDMANSNKMNNKNNEHQSESQTPGNSGKGSSKRSDMTSFAEQEFEKTFARFEGSLQGLVQKLDTIESRVSQLERK